MAKDDDGPEKRRNRRRGEDERRRIQRCALQVEDLRYFVDLFELQQKYRNLRELKMQLRQRGHEGDEKSIAAKMREIESLVGPKLFDFSDRFFRPTTEGREFYRRVREILYGYDRLFDRKALRTLVVGGINTLLSYLVPRFLEQSGIVDTLQLKSIEFVDDEWGALHAQVRRGDLDLAIGPVIHSDDLRIVPLYEHRWTFVYPKRLDEQFTDLQHSPRRADLVAELFRRLRELPVCLLPESMQPDNSFWAKLKKIGKNGRIIVVPTYALALRWVAHNLGVAIVPDPRIYGPLGTNLKFLELPESFGTGQIAMYLPGEPVNPLAETFGAALQAHCTTISP